MVEPKSQSGVNKVDGKLIVIGVLFGAVCAMAGWILSDALRPPSDPLAVMQPAAASAPDGISTATDSPVIPPIFITIATDGTSATAAQSATPRVAAATPPIASRSAEPVQSVSGTTRETRAGSAPQPSPIVDLATSTTFFSRTWIQVSADNGSVVLVGPDGRLVANTGDVAASGVLAVGSTGSDLRSSPSTTAAPDTFSPATMAGSSIPSATVSAGSIQQSGLGSGWPYRTIDIDGFEDHSVRVVGNNQIATNDDSNVFINRDGPINANTGDTDSSGLIAVDVTDTVGRSGASGGVDPADTEEPEDPEDEGAAALTASDDGAPAPAPAGDVAAPATAGSLTIGGDGYDDISVQTQGDGNIVTQDDSNVVIGGTGAVNAQVGDSDTGGLVAMGVHGSDLAAGCAGESCPVD